MKTRDGGVVGLERFSAVGGVLTILADAGGSCAGVHAGVDDIPQVLFREAAVFLDQGREVVLGQLEGEGEANGAKRGGDLERLSDAGEGGAGAGEGLVIEADVLAVGRGVLGDGAHGAGCVGGGRWVGGGGGVVGGDVGRPRS